MANKKQPVYPYQPPGGWFNDSAFFENNFIKSIANNNRWTVSDHQEKKPLDINRILDGTHIWGASLQDGNWPYTNLETIREKLPMATNATYNLDVSIDRKAVIDIEPDCPEYIRQELLQFPFEYIETSMSLKGIHLGVTLDLEDIQYLGSRIVLKGPNKYYEILLRHHVTFSKRMLPIQPPTNPKPLSPFLRQLHDSMPKPVEAKIDTLKNEPKTMRYMQMQSVLSMHEFNKTLSDFENDNSWLEMAMASSAWYRLKRSFASDLNLEINTKPGKTTNIATDVATNIAIEEATWAVSKYLQTRLQPRSKHKEYRQGMPWLLYIATYSITREIVREQQKKEESLKTAEQDLQQSN